MTARPTPDIERVAWGFRAEDRSMQRRTRLGSAVFVDALLPLATRLGPRLGPRIRHRGEAAWARAIGRSLRIRLTITGAEHLAGDGPMILMPLHESFVDVVALLHLPIDPVFTIRDELLHLDRIGSYLDASGQIVVPTERSTSVLRTLHRSVGEALGSGTSVVVFPQGSVLGVEIAFQRGAETMARRSGVPIVPIVLTGTHRVWEYPFSQQVRYGRRVELRVLEPIPARELTSQRFRDTERRMKALALASVAPARRFDPTRDGWWDGYDFEIDPDFPDLEDAVTEHRSARR